MSKLMKTIESIVNDWMENWNKRKDKRWIPLAKKFYPCSTFDFFVQVNYILSLTQKQGDKRCKVEVERPILQQTILFLWTYYILIRMEISFYAVRESKALNHNFRCSANDISFKQPFNNASTHHELYNINKTI